MIGPLLVARVDRLAEDCPVALAVSLGATVLTALTVSGFGHLVLIAEVIIIVLFATYWGVQTKELWDLRDGAEARTVRSVAE